MTLLRSSALIGALTMASRVLGFVREALIAQVLGAGWLSDCFFVAFKLPNLFRRLFAEGAFAAAFVPLLAQLRGQSPDDDGPARAFTDDVLGVLLLVLSGVTAAGLVFMPWVVLALTGGFHDPAPGQTALAIDLARLTFPYLLFVSLTALLAAVLNSVGRFAAAAASPILLNLLLIGALLLLPGGSPATARGLAATVSLAGLAQMVWLTLACRRAGVAPRLRMPNLTPLVRRLGRMAGPVALGQGALQLNILFGTLLAAWALPGGSLSHLTYADRLVQLPVGVIGIAIATALLPAMARSHGAGEDSAARAAQAQGLELTLLLAMPAAFALIGLAGPIVRLVFERGAFNAGDTQATARAVVAYAAGLPAFVIIKALTPGYLSRGDATTPVKVALAGMAVNLVAALSLLAPMGAAGLALATSLAGWVNAALLALLLALRGQAPLVAGSPRRLLGGLALSAATGVLAATAGFGLDDLHGGLLAAGMAATLLVTIGMHLGLALWLGLIPRGRPGV